MDLYRSRWLLFIFTIVTILLMFARNMDSFNFYGFNQSHIPADRELNSSSRTFCVLTRVHGPQIGYFPLFALSLYHSGLENIRIYVINTDNRTDMQLLSKRINYVNELVSQSSFTVLLDLPMIPQATDYGYGITDHALTHLYDQHLKYTSPCQYLMVTNGDNLYSSNFGAKLYPHMKAYKDLIAWGFVSHHFKPHYKEFIQNWIKFVPQVFDDGTGKCTPVALRVGTADLGAVAYRFVFLYKNKLFFREPGKSEPYSFGSDGWFVEKAAKLTKESVILRQTLFMHQ